MEKKGTIALSLVDVFADSIEETADIMVECQDLTDRQRVRVAAKSPFAIGSLFGPPTNRYKLQIDLPGYRTVSLFASAVEKKKPERRVITMAIDPGKVVRVEFPKFDVLPSEARALLGQSDQVVGFPGLSSGALYDGFDDVRRAGFLNIVTKCARTRLSNGRTVLSYFADPSCQLREVRGDRFFARVPKELREETKNSVADNLFDPVSSLLHHPPKDATSAGSFKTPDRAGNLQLTFHVSGDEFQSDIDIDDANGFAHIFQLIQNIGGRTHPYNIQQILVRTQELDPGYRLFVA
jgi:hypothetical protein